MTFDADIMAEMVRRYKRLPEPIWASEIKLGRGTKIEIVLQGEQRVVPAVATGRYERKKHVVWYKDRNGRKWRLRLASSDVIVGYKGEKNVF